MPNFETSKKLLSYQNKTPKWLNCPQLNLNYIFLGERIWFFATSQKVYTIRICTVITIRMSWWLLWWLQHFCFVHGLGIVNRGDWLGRPANIKVTNKDVKIYVGRSTTLHNLLFSLHTLCMSYVTNTFLLVSSSVRSKQLLCFVQGQG